MTLQDWITDLLLGKTPHWWVRYLAAGLITLLSIFIAGVLWRGMGTIPDPGLLLLLTVAVATYLAGGMAGMLSAAIVLFCSFVLFSHPLYPFRYSEMDWRQMMVIIVACPVIALMVGSLKEQVDQLKIVTKEAEALKDEVCRIEIVRETQFICEQRFHLMTECMADYAVCVLDANGSVKNWNVGAERLLGYSDPEIIGQSYSRFFTREDLLGRQPERLLEQARFSGRAVEEGWRLRKGAGRIRTTTSLLALRNSQGGAVGYLLVVHDVTPMTEGHDTAPKS